MLLLSEIRSHFNDYVRGLEKRGIQKVKERLTSVVDLDDKRKNTQQELDDLLSQSNQLSRQIGQMMKEGRKEDAENIKKETAELKSRTKSLNDLLQHISGELDALLYDIPNVPHSAVPEGNKEEDNEIVRQSSELPTLMESAKPHWELAAEYDIIDFELGNKVTGAGFPFYRGQGAQLIRAMVNYFLQEAGKAGYTEIMPPVLINEASGLGTGQLPDKEGQMYHIEGTSLYLIPTAEVPLTNIYRNEIIDSNQLPIKLAGYTQCFRREAGSWGAHVRGLNRLHQFDKVEIVQIADPATSYDVLEEMVQHVEELVSSLQLPYRVLRLCGGDLGFTSALTYDFEVYSAAQKKWLEVSSVSNFETFQSNRLKLRCRDEGKGKTMPHTLNGSALAVPRILAALLENNQHDNHISIPLVLQPFLGYDMIRKVN